ncbi:MAG: MopE-related protein [Myxococcota bacterium]
MLLLALLSCNRPDFDGAGGEVQDEQDTASVDADGDGYDRAEDCDDTDADVHPGAEDTPDDGVDGDCDGDDDPEEEPEDTGRSAR